MPEDEAANVRAQIESIQRRATMAKFVWPLPDKGIRKRLHRIVAPTLLLWGDGDRANPLVYAEEWQRRIKGVVLHESPAATATAITNVLEGGWTAR